ncbi:hypothetical protein NMY22_g18919 [Coprinellus aureogranulatus]|nr:hypothetical protein NMY22_g18919 [Coprinellus aureogranulatus]
MTFQDPLPPHPAEAKLKDPTFMKKMKAALCPGLFETVNSKVAQDIIAACKAHCDGSDEILSRVLQTKFIANHSPLYWALAGVKGAAAGTTQIPPILTELLLVSGKLSAEIQEEILDPLIQNDNDALFQLLQVHLPGICIRPIETDNAFDYRPAMVSRQISAPGTVRFNFNIPQFFDRITIYPARSTRLIGDASGSLWTLTAALTDAGPSTTHSVNSNWGFIVSEISTQNPDAIVKPIGAYTPSRSVSIVINSVNVNIAKHLELRGHAKAKDKKRPSSGKRVKRKFAGIWSKVSDSHHS